VGQNEALAEIEKARKQKREVAMEVKSQIMNQNELEREISNMEKRKLTYTKQLEKFESVFSTVYRIDKICRERGIQGYHGLFLHHIKCTNESMLQCVDLAAKSQLFSIIVDKFETAKEILDINKSIRGTVINIYPLESMNQVYSDRQSQVPNNKIKKLSEYVKLNANSNPLL
jgi:chromosome segregation ATPase